MNWRAIIAMAALLVAIGAVHPGAAYALVGVLALITLLRYPDALSRIV